MTDWTQVALRAGFTLHNFFEEPDDGSEHGAHAYEGHSVGCDQNPSPELALTAPWRRDQKKQKHGEGNAQSKQRAKHSVSQDAREHTEASWFLVGLVHAWIIGMSALALTLNQ
jgi:hypothetical protein